MQTILGGLKLDIELVVYDRQEKPKPTMNPPNAQNPQSRILQETEVMSGPVDKTECPNTN
jgi:hypothetical protein